jgi:hypothetical protein
MPAYVALLREFISLSKEIALHWTCDRKPWNLALEVARESTMSYGQVWAREGGWLMCSCAWMGIGLLRGETGGGMSSVLCVSYMSGNRNWSGWDGGGRYVN